jgi:hypothetical protein
VQKTNHRLNGQTTNATAMVQKGGTGKKTSAKKWTPKADRVLYWSATTLPWLLAILLLAVSMPHLASGFQRICHCGAVSGWLLAVAIDSAQVVAKLQLTMLRQYTTCPYARWTSAGIVAGTSLMSMALNVLAFLQGATDTTGTVLAWTAGVMLPLLILALSYTGSSFMLAKVKRQTKAKVGKSK